MTFVAAPIARHVTKVDELQTQSTGTLSQVDNVQYVFLREFCMTWHVLQERSTHDTGHLPRGN